MSDEGKTPIQIRKATRERLATYLLDKAPRGQGYSDFIEQALDAALAEKTDNSHRFAIEVFEPEYDADDVPLVGGFIQLTNAEYGDLRAKLDRFEKEGVLDHYSLERAWDVPQVFAIEGVYNFITGDIDHTDDDLRALWDGTEVPA
jgi:hypothetical protein